MPAFDSHLIAQVKEFLEAGLPRSLELLKEMVGINSFTENAAGVNRAGSHTAALFERLGFSAETIQSENPKYGKHLLCTRKGESPAAVGCLSHLDTVFPEEEEKQNGFAWREEGDRIYGPGTNDIKGGTLVLYMMLEALSTFFPEQFSTVTWKLLFDASEETDSEDFGGICIEQLKMNGIACLVFEAGNARKGCWPVVTGRKGRAVFRITTAGRAAHAGSSLKSGASAILQMADVIKIVSGFTDFGRNITVNVGSVIGGTGLNRVPHYCEAGVEMRAFSMDAFNEGINKILSLNNHSSVKSPDGGFACNSEVRLLRKVTPWQKNSGTEHLFEFWADAGRYLGMAVEERRRGGLSDANYTWMHIPTIDGLGPTGENAHCSEHVPGRKEQEYALKSSFVPKTLLNLLAVVELIESNRTPKAR